MNIPYRRDPIGGYLNAEAEVHNAILLRLELIIVLLSCIAVLLMLVVVKI